MKLSEQNTLLFLLSQVIPTPVNSQQQLSTAQYQVLHLLVQEGPMNLSDLAEARGVRKPTMTAIMEQLLTRQWVLHAMSKTDARQKIYLITNKGRTLYQEVTNESLATLQHIWSDYTETQWHDCLTMLDTLLNKNHD